MLNCLESNFVFQFDSFYMDYDDPFLEDDVICSEMKKSVNYVNTVTCRRFRL